MYGFDSCYSCLLRRRFFRFKYISPQSHFFYWRMGYNSSIYDSISFKPLFCRQLFQKFYKLLYKSRYYLCTLSRMTSFFTQISEMYLTNCSVTGLYISLTEKLFKKYSSYTNPLKIYSKQSTYDIYALCTINCIISYLSSTSSSILIHKVLNLFYNSFDIFFLNLTSTRLRLNTRLLFDVELLFNNIFLTVKFVTLRPLINLISKSINNLNIFKHKSFFSFFFFFFKTKFERYFKFFRIRGVFISIKGKIGVTGDSRKRRLFLNLGQSSRFNLTSSVVFKKTKLITGSGVLGLQMWWFFT